MAEVNFDRQPFVTAQQQSRRADLSRVLGGLVLAIGFAAVAFLGYKLIMEYSGSNSSETRQGLDAIQQQLATIETRIDRLEQHHRTVASGPTAPVETAKGGAPTATRVPERRSFKITPASVLPAQADPNSHLANMQSTGSSKVTAAQPVQSPSVAYSAEKDEVWQATADRLSDVVGVVGTQQGEISKTREELNKLLAETRRSAIPFELRHGAPPEPVGPVSLVLKNSDARNMRYTVCVVFDDKCVELKNRAANEVVVFVVSSNSAPLELVVTKVLRDQIVGYLEVPVRPLS